MALSDCLCACGCGRLTNVVNGKPRGYVHGHNARKRKDNYESKDCGYLTPCLVWRGTLDKDGYALLGGKRVARAVYEQSNDIIAAGLQVDHLCRVRACVNVEHLEAVTSVVNVRRSRATKLTYEAASLVRQSTDTYANIGRVFGVSVQTVCDIKKGRIWRSAA